MPASPRPLMITDFSGGITDNILQDDPRRADELDNIFITPQKKLIERPGFKIFSDTGYNLPVVGSRYNGFYSFRNETVLMAQSSRQIFYANIYKEWTQILGVAGNPALEGGDAYSQTTYSEFQRKIYLATDGSQGDATVLPTKIYQDDTNTWVAKTVGLPRVYAPATTDEKTLLAKCIVLANDLRARMLEHMDSAQNQLFLNPYTNAVSQDTINIHLNRDLWGESYFQSVVFNGDPTPAVIPTPRGAATDEASLYLLVRALNDAYTHHVIDDKKTGFFYSYINPGAFGNYQPMYHWAISVEGRFGSTVNVGGPSASLDKSGTPTTIEEAVEMLNDLHQKWNWHRKGVFTHSPTNLPLQFDKFATTVPKIDTYTLKPSAPLITPDFTDVWNYVNNLKHLYNSHVNDTNGSITLQTNHALIQVGVGGTGGYGEYSTPLVDSMTLPDATDLDSAFLNIYWLRNLYNKHLIDAQNATLYQRAITFTSVLNSPNISAVVDTTLGSTTTLGVGSYIYSNTNFQSNGVIFQNRLLGGAVAARVISSALGTAVLDRPIVSTAGTLKQAVILGATSHVYQDTSNASLPTGGTNQVDDDNILGADPSAVASTVAGWLLLSDDLMSAFGNHAYNRTVHTAPSDFTSQLIYQLSMTRIPYPNFIRPEVATFSYAFYYSDEYTVEQNGIEYLVQGNPVISSSQECIVSYPTNYSPPDQVNFYNIVDNVDFPIITQRANVISRIPILTNNSTTNYATSKIKVNIYRTTNAGATWYKLAELDNGTTTYSDTVNDSISGGGGEALNLQTTLYTTGGITGHDQPPECKFTHILDGFTYYAAVTDTGQFFPNRIRQSVQNIPDAAPATFYDDLDDEITGVSSTRSNLLVFCKNSIFRVEGNFNSQGQGAMKHDKISDTLGCLNAKSIVRTEVGVFYAGNDGFYYTDGYQNIKISLELDETYQSLTQSESQKRSIYGNYDKITRRVWWAMKEFPTDSDNSVMYGFYLDFGVKPSGTFTTISNGINFRPSSFVFQQGILYWAHEKGYLLRADNDAKTDALIDSSVSATLWKTTLIPYNYTTVAMDMGTSYNRKWITKAHIISSNNGNIAAQIYALRDLNQTSQGALPLAPINYTENFTWGQPNFVWGDPNFRWKTDGKMDLFRRFPARTLRSDVMQVKIVPANICVYASSIGYPDFAYVSAVDLGGGQSKVTVNTPTGYTNVVWPLDVVGYELKLSSDDYTTGYPILEVNGNEVTIEGSLTISLGSSISWEIWGTKKEQRFSMNTLEIQYSLLAGTNEAYPGAKSNDGSGNAGENPG